MSVTSSETFSVRNIYNCKAGKKNILKRPPPDSIPDIEEVTEELNINGGRISKEETKRAIKNLKLGKTSGIDNIPSDILY